MTDNNQQPDGIVLVFHFGTIVTMVEPERITTTLTESGLTVPKRVMAKYQYASNELRSNPHLTKLDAVAENESLIRKHLYNADVGMFWDIPTDSKVVRAWIDHDEMHQFLTVLSEGRRPFRPAKPSHKKQSEQV